MTSSVSSRNAEARQFLVFQSQTLRGVGILAVILLHVTALFTEKQYGVLTYPLVALNSLTRFAVPLFVVLSAMHLNLNRRNQRAFPFYRRTIKYLLIPYALYSFFYWIPKGLAGGGLLGLIRALLLGRSSYHLWFIVLIAQLYVLHPLLSRWYEHCRHRGALLMLAFSAQISWSLVFTFWFPSLTLPAAVRALLAVLYFPSAIGYFFGGYFLLEHAETVVRLARCRSTLLAVAAAGLTSTAVMAASWLIPLSGGVPFAEIPHPYLIHDLLSPVQTLSALALVLYFAQRVDRGLPCRWLCLALNSLGLYAYGIYYLHVFVLQSESYLLKRVFPGGEDRLGFCVALAALVPFTSWLAARLLARTPLGRYLT